MIYVSKAFFVETKWHLKFPSQKFNIFLNLRKQFYLMLTDFLFGFKFINDLF